MTNKPNDGGPAFPVPDGADDGLSKRDYFAAAALTGLIAATVGMHGRGCVELLGERLAKAAYDAAEAMLKERNV